MCLCCFSTVDVESYVSGAEEELKQRVCLAEAQKLAAAHQQQQQQQQTQQRQQPHNSTSNCASVTSHPTSTGAPDDSTYINYEDEDFVDDAAFDASHVAPASGVGENRSLSAGYASMSASSSHRAYPQPCVAIYDFKVSFHSGNF